MKGMKESFETNLEKSRTDEANALKTFNDMKAAKSEEIAAGKTCLACTTSTETRRENEEKEKTETEELAGEKEAELAATKADLEAESKDMAADQDFLKELTGACEEKAKLFDQRSSTRAAELT